MAVHPFELLEPLAVGGMGEVWRGRHRRSDRLVAIKVLTSSEARQPEAWDSFRAEVRAAAGLDHPQIAWVLDYGPVPGEWEERTEGSLVAGSPYMVVEEARGGDLRGWIRTPPPWSALCQALLQLLDALAFAHARGVIHRDLKPANVLLATHREARQGVLLTDFGVAHRMSALPEPGYLPRAGTVSCMAPEQIAGDWRAYGPWTDLYALGVLAWTITQGEVPDPGEDGSDYNLEWKTPRFPTPEGLAGWLARLLREDPAERFQTAASAAHGLRALDQRGHVPRFVMVSRGTARSPEALPQSDGDPTLSHLLWTGRTLAAPPRVRTLRLATAPMEAHTPPPPPSWRPPTPPPAPLGLVDAGLSLYGLRDRPVVGREAERDALWAQLTTSIHTQSPRVVLLSGPLGTGKSRLLRWLGERADELGVALHGAARLGADADGGLLAALRRALRATGLEGEGLAQHLERTASGLFSADERRILLTLFSDGGEGTSGAGRSAGERYAVILRALRRVAGQRAVVIALDDAQQDPDGLELAQHLLQTGGAVAGPTLLVLASRDDALAERPELARAWAGLCERPEVLSLGLGPLHPEDWPRLADAGLALAPHLRDRVAARSAGNPLFAELIVSDWVQRAQLVVGPDGFDLAPGVEAALPDHVSSLVSGQLSALRASRGPDDLRALQIAATLGLDVQLREWSAACAIAGVTPQPDLLDAAMGRRLLRPLGEGGFGFCQNMLREALLAEAAAEGREAEHHRSAADALAELPGGGADRLGRLGRHRLAAGQPTLAGAPLLEAARAASLTGRYAELRALLELLDRVLPALEGAAADLVCARLWTLRGHLKHFGQGDRAEARACYARAIEAAERAGQPDLVLDTRRRLGGVTFGLGEQRAAERILRETLAAARETGDLVVQIDTASDLATVLLHGGLPDEMREVGLLASTLAAQLGREDLLTKVISTNWYLDTLPTLADRVASLESSAAAQRRLNMPQHLGTTLNQLGAYARDRGDDEATERYYLEAMNVFDEIGSSYASMPRFNLSVLYSRQERLAETWTLLRRCLQDVLAHRWVWLEPHVRTFMARLEIEAGEKAAFDEHLDRVEALWRAGGAAEYNVALTLETAVRSALALPDGPRARRAATLARDLYQAGGHPKDAARMEDLLSSDHLSSTD